MKTKKTHEKNSQAFLFRLKAQFYNLVLIIPIATPVIGITLDCNPNTKVLRSAYPQMIAESEEGETILYLPLTGGVVAALHKFNPKHDETGFGVTAAHIKMSFNFSGVC